MSIVEEFLYFFNDLIAGKNIGSASNDEVLNTIQSESTMEAVSLKLNTTFKKFTQTTEQNLYANKKITIDCGVDKLTDWHLKPKGQRYTWFGEKIPNTSCIKYGCCYDVTQTANISLSAINETTTSDHQEMWNTVKQEMLNQVKLTLGNNLGDNDSKLQVLNSAMNQVKDLSVSNIKKVLENASSINLESEQDINIISLSPIRCINKCSEPPTAGSVEQSLNVEIATNNIITDITKAVTETYISMVSKTESSISNIDMKKIYMFAILSCLLIITIFTISYIIVNFVILKGKGPELVAHAGAALMTVIWLMFWSFIVCLIRSGGLPLFCLIR